MIIDYSELVPYAGIGSRETPKSIQNLMTRLAVLLASHKFLLRSGGANGADLAFENGINDPFLKEIYLPSSRFNKSQSSLVLDKFENASVAYEAVVKYHPNHYKLKPYPRKLMARNTYQVFGQELFDNPKLWSKFIICWTPGGASTGGTSQAIRMATDYNIPIYNLFNYDHLVSLIQTELSHLDTDQVLASLLSDNDIREYYNLQVG